MLSIPGAKQGNKMDLNYKKMLPEAVQQTAKSYVAWAELVKMVNGRSPVLEDNLEKRLKHIWCRIHGKYCISQRATLILPLSQHNRYPKVPV